MKPAPDPAAVAAPAARRRLGRSAVAVVAGAVISITASYAIDSVLVATGLMRGTDALPLSGSAVLVGCVLAYRTVFNVVGCYVTGRLAPARPVAHALVLGGVGMLGGTAGALAGTGTSPTWYSWGLVVLSLPAALLGGLLAARQRSGREAQSELR